MNEAQARAALNVPRETLARFDAFVDLLRAENERQNLVSRGSLEQVWLRHILDSAQLLRLAPEKADTWLDLGTGPGFPGLIIAALHPARVTLVEARKLRVEFLRRAAAVLGIEDQTTIVYSKVEAFNAPSFDVISARAFAPLERLLALGHRFAALETRWVLPKGRNANSELEAVRSLWQGDFRLEPSLTDPDAQIVVAEKVQLMRRGKRSK